MSDEIVKSIADYFAELKELSEQYRKAHRYQFVDVRQSGKAITILFYSIHDSEQPHIDTAGKQKRGDVMRYKYKKFNENTLPLQIEQLKVKNTGNK